MQPPRYLLREAALQDLLRGLPRGRFLEVGYGAGFTLVTLSRLGFNGLGFDSSAAAHDAASALLREHGIRGVSLVRELPTGERFDYVVLLEVVGYFEEPGAELARLATLLKPSGRLLLSFSGKNATYARSVDSDMRTFTRHEMLALAQRAGLADVVIHNYGFPLVNAMRPVLNAYQTLRGARPEVGSTGLQHTAPLTRAVARAFSGSAILPFARAQRLFRHTELGNGYVLSARRA